MLTARPFFSRALHQSKTPTVVPRGGLLQCRCTVTLELLTDEYTRQWHTSQRNVLTDKIAHEWQWTCGVITEGWIVSRGAKISADDDGDLWQLVPYAVVQLPQWLVWCWVQPFVLSLCGLFGRLCTSLLFQLVSRTDVATCGFRHVAAVIWSSLPRTVLESTSVFESGLKTQLAIWPAIPDRNYMTCAATAFEVMTSWRDTNVYTVICWCYRKKNLTV